MGLVRIASTATGLVLVLSGRIGRRGQPVQRTAFGDSSVRRGRLGLLGRGEWRGHDRLDSLRGDPAPRSHLSGATGRSQRDQQDQRQETRESNAPRHQIPLRSGARRSLRHELVEELSRRPGPV